MRIRYVLSLLTAVLTLGACTAMPALSPTAEPEHEEASSHEVHWAYEGEGSPEHWAELESPKNIDCGRGQSQSPIDVVQANPQDLENVAIHYQPSDLRVWNNGHTVQAVYDAGSYIELDGERYDVAQFHYHAPSEHTIAGKSFAAEFHIVHKQGDRLAVVGILLEAGAENAGYQAFLDNLPAVETPETNVGVKVNAADLLPAVQTTYRYTGSLTTPPCTEGVNWVLMTTPVQISAAQISALETVFEGNNRPVQSLNTRSLVEDNTP